MPIVPPLVLTNASARAGWRSGVRNCNASIANAPAIIIQRASSQRRYPRPNRSPIVKKCRCTLKSRRIPGQGALRDRRHRCGDDGYQQQPSCHLADCAKSLAENWDQVDLSGSRIAEIGTRVGTPPDRVYPLRGPFRSQHFRRACQPMGEPLIRGTCTGVILVVQPDQTRSNAR